MVEAREIFSELTAITKPMHCGKVKNLMLGENKSLRVGGGYEIHNIREWQPEDPLEHIDLEASLPTWPKKVYVLEMFEMKNAPVIFVADISPSMFVGFNESGGKFKLLLQSLGALGLGANRLRDPAGILCFSDKIEFYLPPRFGSGWLCHLSRLLYSKAEKFETLKRSGRLTVAGSDLNSALRFLIVRLARRQCSIAIFSDFVDVINGQTELDPKVIRTLSALHNFNVIAIFLDEPEEFAWNRGSGTVAVQDAETGNIEIIKSREAKTLRQRFIERREELRKRLQKVGIDSTVISYGDHFNQLAQFLSERKAIHR